MDARPGVPAGEQTGLTGESKMAEQTVASGVVTEIAALTQKQQNGGNIHVIKDAIPGHVLIKVPGKETYDQIKVQKARKLTVESLGGVAQLVALAVDKYDGEPVVFVSRDGVDVSFDENKDSLFLVSGHMPHRFTPEWLSVKAHTGRGAEYTLDDFREWLRVTMKDAATESSVELQKAMVAVHVTQTGSMANVRTDTSHRVGRDLESEVVIPGAPKDSNGNAKIPDRFRLTPRVTMERAIDYRQEVEFAFHIDPDDMSVKVVANGPQIEAGIDEMLKLAVEEITSDLSEYHSDVPVILGSVA